MREEEGGGEERDMVKARRATSCWASRHSCKRSCCWRKGRKGGGKRRDVRFASRAC